MGKLIIQNVLNLLSSFLLQIQGTKNDHQRDRVLFVRQRIHRIFRSRREQATTYAVDPVDIG